MSEQRSVSGGIGLPGALFLLFLGLKLTGYIGWSWWWVFAPIWGSFALGLIIFIIYILKEL